MFDDKEISEKCSIRDEVEDYFSLISELEKAMLNAGYKKDDFKIQIERKKKWDLADS